MAEINWADFEKIDIRIGTIVDAKDFPEAHNPSYKLWIDFGNLGNKPKLCIRKSIPS